MRLFYLASLLIGVFGQRALYNASHGPTGYALDEYHTFAEITDFVVNTIGAYDNVTVEVIGQTFENNDLLAVIINDHGDNEDIKWMVFECGLHAREWISALFCQLMMYELLQGQYQSMREHTKFIFMPMMNPDGYEYSRITENMWRKNRSVNQGSTSCRGTDLNRNHKAWWISLTGASSDKCDDTYAGKSQESELENEAKADFMSDYWDKGVELYLAIHSHVDCIFVPPGVRGKDYDNQDQLMELAELTSDFIKSNSILISDDQVQAMNDWNNGLIAHCECSDDSSVSDCPCFTKNLKNGLHIEMKTHACTADSLGEGSGGADDWALLKGAKYAYTPELPPSYKNNMVLSYGEHISFDQCDIDCGGFQPPKEFLLHYATQYMAGFEYMHNIAFNVTEIQKKSGSKTLHCQSIIVPLLILLALFN